jgi:ABC-type multidrug transport system permease subunit
MTEIPERSPAMTTVLDPPATARSGGALRRTRALAAAETRLLLRNRTAVVNSVLAPVLLVAAVRLVAPDSVPGAGPALVVTAIAVGLVFTTYYNLVTTFVARREERVLQRMRTGELTDLEVLLGTALPSLLVTLVQVVVVLAGAVVIGEWSTPVDVVLPVLATVAGGLLMLLLAAASTAFTGTAESAQITTMPVVVAATSLSGLFVPLTAFPEQLASVARFLPLTPVVELTQLGLAGRTWDGVPVEDLAGAWAHAPLPAAVLAGWLLIAAVVTPRVFRWAPRR